MLNRSISSITSQEEAMAPLWKNLTSRIHPLTRETLLWIYKVLHISASRIKLSQIHQISRGILHKSSTHLKARLSKINRVISKTCKITRNNIIHPKHLLYKTCRDKRSFLSNQWALILTCINLKWLSWMIHILRFCTSIQEKLATCSLG